MSAVMMVVGCVVNRPRAAKRADPGVVSDEGNGRTFVTSQMIRTAPESQIGQSLIQQAMRLADSMRAAGLCSGEPTAGLG